MKKQNREMDMLQNSLADKILLFTLPIAFASMLQQLFNVADTSIVGRFDRSDALAAVGTNGEIIAFIVSLSSGLSIGVNVLIASQIGKKDFKKISPIIHTTILFAIGFGVVLLIAGQYICVPLLQFIQTPDNILSSAEIYLSIYLLGCPFLLLYDFCSAILRARGDSRYPFLALTAAGIINVLLNILFVAVFHMSVAGVSIATDLSTLLCALMVMYRLKKDTTEFHLSPRSMRIHCDILLRFLKIGIPSAIQEAVFCIVPIVVFPEDFTKIFSDNPSVIENAVLRIHSIFFFEAICSFYEIPAGVLRGMGYSLLPAVATVIGTCAFRILWICTVFDKYPSLTILYKAFPVSWTLTIVLIGCGFIIIFLQKKLRTNFLAQQFL